MTLSGLTRSDWENSAFADFARAIELSSVTITKSNVSGADTRTYAPYGNINAIFSLRGEVPVFYRDEEGLYQDADAYCSVPIATIINVYDKVRADGIEYLVKTVKEVRLPFTLAEQAMFKFCPLARIG